MFADDFIRGTESVKGNPAKTEIHLKLVSLIETLDRHQKYFIKRDLNFQYAPAG